jgi:hypothetical protein
MEMQGCYDLLYDVKQTFTAHLFGICEMKNPWVLSET